MGVKSPHPAEKEIAIPMLIPKEHIRWRIKLNQEGQIEDYEINYNYKPIKVDNE